MCQQSILTYKAIKMHLQAVSKLQDILIETLYSGGSESVNAVKVTF